MFKVMIVMLLLSLNANFINAQLGQEKVELYGIKIKAKEVTGQNEFIGSSDYYRADLLNPLIPQKENEFVYYLGSYRRDKKKSETLDLFNLSFQRANFPLLDQIDFDFYINFGIDLVAMRWPHIANQPLHQELISRIKVGRSTDEMKSILFDPKYDELRNYLILTRYDVDTSYFTVEKSRTKKVSVDLKVEMENIIKLQGLESDGSLKAFVKNLTDEFVNVTGSYYIARFNPSYISKIHHYLNEGLPLPNGNNQFDVALKNYILLDKKNRYLNSGLVAIQLKGSYDKSRINSQELASEISAKFQIASDKASKLAANISTAFTNFEKISFISKFNNVWLLRYSTSSILRDLEFRTGNFVTEIR